VTYIDLPVYGTPMRLCWKKHRMRCVSPRCDRRTFLVQDHRIAAKNCLLTTRAAKWATVQVGGGRTVSEVAAELACDWHTVNDAVTTYGKALLEADRKRLNKTTAIGLDETSFVKLSRHAHTDYATTVADVENHQIIDILSTRKYTDVAGWIDKQPAAWKERILSVPESHPSGGPGLSYSLAEGPRCPAHGPHLSLPSLLSHPSDPSPARPGSH
jgi:transposase